MELKNQVTNAVQTSLLEYIINSVKVSQVDRNSIHLDGNICNITVETVTFLHALCEYDTVLDTLPDGIAYTATTKPFLTTINKKTLSLQEVVELNARLQLEVETQAEQQQMNNGLTINNLSTYDNRDIAFSSPKNLLLSPTNDNINNANTNPNINTNNNNNSSNKNNNNDLMTNKNNMM